MSKLIQQKQSNQHHHLGSLQCQQGDNDFTVVTASKAANKENLCCTTSTATAATVRKPSHAQTVSQALVRHQRQLMAIVNLENAILLQSFRLIENYYRPSTSHTSITADSVNLSSGYSKKKRRAVKNRGQTVIECPAETANVCEMFKMPRKRVHGLLKAYQTEYQTKIGKNGILEKHLDSFHHSSIDWQLVFAAITGFPLANGNLAKELNYDSLFDYEDAIAMTAVLLANARQHYELIEGITLCRETDQKRISTDYDPENRSYSGSENFRKIIEFVQQLIEHKEEQINKQTAKEAKANKQLASFWFMSCDNTLPVNTVDSGDQEINQEYFCEENSQIVIKDLQKEIEAWEEFVDIVDIM